MKLIKVESEKTLEFAIVPSDDLQDAMYCIERFFQERRTPKVTGKNPRLIEPLRFDVYGTAEFDGYNHDGTLLHFKAEIVPYRSYIVNDCELSRP